MRFGFAMSSPGVRSVTRTASAAFLIGVAGMTLPGALRGQGSISTQGFGYPGGELSTRALGTGGAIADFDPMSPINPAALATGGRASIYFQYDPEFRTVNVGSLRANTVTARFPVFSITGQLGRATLGLSFANLLDRTWTNTYPDTQVVNGEVLASTVIASSAGGINDVRLAGAYTVGKMLQVGLGIHVFPGDNQVVLGRQFPDSQLIGNFKTTTRLTYSGSAISLGAILTPVRHVNVAMDARFGGDMRVRLNDSIPGGAGRVPMRWSAGLAYDGIAGSLFSVRYGSERWSDLKGLGTPGLVVQDATELSAGAEIAGPKLTGLPSSLRLGYRSRELPFAANGQKVNEQAWNGGAGIPVARGRGTIELGLAHADRTTSGTLSEVGWIVSVGFAIRP